MGRASGVSRRRKKKFNYNKNLKKLHKKLITLPKVRCKQIKEAWDTSKSYTRNMVEMGLSDDPNKTIGLREKKPMIRMPTLLFWRFPSFPSFCMASAFTFLHFQVTPSISFPYFCF
ncbi:nucleolar protein 16 [Caerostris extrusa]|uniref:Nucleolar protein 16 n=1 Tax=Caerostris extrusa TaxID=172846 RepID=A0AAV4WUZ4_CAEEX|nr:nucleolar protein 16 [Caerostris extrusa]